MTKVKLDVMRPWIAKRVTELIGFEDEVLINFIYGLLEGKEVNGKEVQISLTGFMERNTGKFMKELWLLLLSAQQNLSGIPLQFLDAKEEETKKKKAETDRIAHEILRKKDKEKQELELESTKMDGDGDMLRDKPAKLELNSKLDSMVFSFQPADKNKQSERKSMSGCSRDSKSPDLAYYPSSTRLSSRSVSRSPPPRSRSISSEKWYPTSPRRSPVPRKRHVVRPSPSPPRRRSSYYSKQRSISPSWRRSPSPSRYRARFPRRYRSRSPLSHRSRSPFNRRSRSPRRRSRTPIWRSTSHNRSTCPSRHRSPSPIPRKSPSPARRRSPFPVQRRTSSPLSDKSSHGLSSPSPLRRSRSAFHRKPPYVHQDSRSPVRRRYKRSPSIPWQQSTSPVQPMPLTINRKRSLSPAPRRSPRESSSPLSIQRRSISPVRRETSKSLRSHQLSRRETVRHLSCLLGEIREQKYGARRTSSLIADQRKDLTDSTTVHVLDDVLKSKKSQLTSSERIPDSMNHREHCGKSESSQICKTIMSENKGESYVDEGDRDGDVSSGPLGDSKRGFSLQEPEVLLKLLGKSVPNDLNGSTNSPFKEYDEQKYEVKEKKKHKKSDRHDVKSDDYFSDDSYKERKEVRRRRKEEKRLKKEERRRRRDERHHKREERHSDKWRLKSVDTGGPLSDLAGDYSDGNDHRWESQARGNKDTKSEQINLEIELREKALESLRAKKGIGNSKE
ncbi:serine/arginine repetitive matrix protein 1-like [Dorcoceras hygrometricum]|uniref:Serine/arginine repetitive matrix protein 1-like n=1 Tax=Dorcoceras hygrometricum TaxID=472368 RepID=A0A2Z7BHK5_9LAMI|nr:serine/arginine repetitive matrix protein 1-like [Dorcoceras hygrometricum]